MRFSLALALPLALTVAALKVTEPAKGAEVDVSKSFTVKWDSVNTDESSVNIVLVNNAVYPPVEEKIASDIDTSKGTYTASGLKGVTKGHGFQVNLLSTSEHNTGILAQSQQFNVTAGSDSSSTTTTGTSSTVSSSSTSGATTGTTTQTSSAETSSTGTSSPRVPTGSPIEPPTGAHTGTSAGVNTSKHHADHSSTATGVATLTGTATGTTTGSSTKTGLATSASASGSVTGSNSASPTPTNNSAMSIIAQPITVAVVMFGALALNF